MKRYYFDYAASTPVDPVVEKAMRPYWSGAFGNPGSLHSFGQKASAAVFKARDTIAKSLGCHYSEIIFTGSATESNNIALRGITSRFYRGSAMAPPSGQTVRRITQKNFGNGPRSVSDSQRPKLIISAVEHNSVLDTARDLEKEGVEVVYLPVSKNGIVDLEKLKKELDERTILVSIMYANNEVGVIQPISEIAKIISDFRKELRIKNNESGKNSNSIIHNSRFTIPLLHTDAVQAFNYLPCNVNDLGVDLLTLSAQKIYGPKGIGALYARQNYESGSTNNGRKNSVIPNSRFIIHPIITGGGQENGMRSGTENVPGIVGFAKAVELVAYSREWENKRLGKLQNYFLSKIKKIAPKAELNGDIKNRLPNNINVYFPDASGQDMIIKLDLAGFAVSPGSACSARVCSPSHVLKALGHSDERATNSIRITFGRQTNKEAIDKLLVTIKNIK